MQDEHDRRLRDRVHPPGWRNPVPRRRYHLVVLGGGPAGLVAAAGAAGLGARVALIERGLLGGDCLNVGCVPSKALLRSARAIHQARGAERFGLRLTGPVEPDFAAAMQRLRRLRADLAVNDSAERFRSLGVDVFLGEGRFVDPGAVEVEGARLDFHRALVATGARSMLPPVPGLEQAAPLTSETVFDLTSLPRRIVMIGAGPVGAELGQALARFGAEVSFVSLDPRLLPREDPDAAALLEARLRAEGIRLELGARLVSAERTAAGCRLVYRRGEEDHGIVADELFLGIGRAPNVEGLALERAGIELDGNGIRVDDRLRTSNPRVYAAGDVCSPWKFTHAADAMARIALRNALFAGRARVSALTIPWVTYTDPEIAHVGLYPPEAAERGIEIETLETSFADNDRARLEGEDEGFARLHLARGSDRILGATVVGHEAGELLAEVVLAMSQRIGLARFSGAIHSYPTRGAVWQRLGDAFSRRRLTPGVRRLFEAWLGLWA